jgi:hypothetical protein
MAHYPLDHPMRPVYRLLSGLAGLYLALFGIIGIAVTWGDSLTERGDDWVLGLRTNPAAAWLAAVAGLAVLAAAVIGGNLQHRLAVVLGWGTCGYALLTMAFIRTDANVFNVSMVNVIVLAVLGLVVLAAGLYTKTDNA